MTKTFLLVLLISLYGPLAFGRDGPGVSGGGNELVADFVSIATELLARVPFADAERQLLKNTLGTTKIVTVSVLVDPATGQPVPNQSKLLAWGSPGQIQLKTRATNPGDDSFEQAMESGETVAHIVIHELYRASGAADAGGASPDDTFQISIGKYHLDRDSTGAALKPDNEQFLYAECKVTACARKGFWQPKEADTVCKVTKPQFSMGWSGATVQVFKYAGTDLNQQHNGFLGINNLSFNVGGRMGNENYSSIEIADGETYLTVVGRQGQAYRNFTITYSTREKPVTTGHAEIEFISPWRSWVELELSDCHTTQ